MSAGHRHAPPGEHEHEFESQPGLPEPLPAGERLLWQGTPDWRDLAVHAFHARKVAIYFASILLLRGGFVLADDQGLLRALVSMAWLAPLAAFAIGTLLALAWLTARTTVYTITSRRVVMRIGIVLTLTFNLPLRCIGAAGLRLDRNGRGDIPLTLAGSDRIAWVHLWPHVRPWSVSRPQPMLRAVSDAGAVAQLLTDAWVQARDGASHHAAGPAPQRPSLPPSGRAPQAVPAAAH